MEVHGKYRVRIGSRTSDCGDYANTSELVGEIGGKKWTWLETLIDELLVLKSFPVLHPSGHPWKFMIYVNFYGGKDSKEPSGIRLWVMPREIREGKKIPTILLRADQPLTLQDSVAYLQRELGA